MKRNVLQYLVVACVAVCMLNAEAKALSLQINLGSSCCHHQASHRISMDKKLKKMHHRKHKVHHHEHRIAAGRHKQHSARKHRH
ncbi:MAG: hypothetical protein IKK45_01190 [Akkermansia sp.]|nr:hypothetical protein [Akkermansia sp.]